MKLVVEQREDGIYLLFSDNSLIKVDQANQSEILQSIRSTYEIPFVEPCHPYSIPFDGQVRVRYEYHNLCVKDGKINEEWIIDSKKQWDQRVLTHRKRKLAVLLSAVGEESEQDLTLSDKSHSHQE